MTTAPDRTGLSRADILPMGDYARIRADKRREMVAVKKNRRVSVGPSATFHFESYETMWLQIHEMLYIEKGGEEQIPDELRAYNPLIPKGDELVATLMFEIDDPIRRNNLLNQLGGVENTITLQFAGETVTAMPERDVERTSEEGKASSVHFIRFPFSAEKIAKFREPGTRTILGIGHDQYAHMAVLPEAIRHVLAGDFR
jgi:hypothetical protein